MKFFSRFNLHTKYPTLKIEHFKNLWIGQIISQAGDACYFWIFMFMVDRITGSIVKVAFTQFIELLPFFLFSPIAGVIADRVDRRKIMLFCDISSFLILALLGVYALVENNVSEWVIYFTAFSMSTINALFSPAKSASIPTLVPKKYLLEANGLSNSTENFTPLLGIALSAATFIPLYNLSPYYFFGAAILFNSFTFLGSAFYISKIPALNPMKRESVQQGAIVQSTRDLFDGFKYILQHPLLRMVMFLKLLAYIFTSPFNTAYISVNTQWFGGEPLTFAYIEMAFCISMVIGSLIVAKSKIKHLHECYAKYMVIIGLSVIGMAYSYNVHLFVLFNIICGLAVPFSSIPITTYIQSTVSAKYLGRVNGMMIMLTWGVMSITILFFGSLFEKIGLSNVFLIVGVGHCLCGVLAYFSPAMRKAKLVHEQKDTHESTKPMEPTSKVLVS